MEDWQEERDAIVAWLRDPKTGWADVIAVQLAADGIERGDHQFESCMQAMKEFGAASRTATLPSLTHEGK